MSLLKINTTGESFKEEIIGESELPASSPQESKKKNRSLFSVSFYVFFLGFLLLPLFFIPSFGFSIELSKTFLLGVVVVLTFSLWIIAQLKEGVFSFPKSLLLASGTLVVVVVGVSALFSPSSTVSLGGSSLDLGTFASMLLLFVLMFLGANLFDSQSKIVSFFLFVPIAFFLLFLFLASRLLFGADFLSFGIFTGLTTIPVGKWNDFAIFSGFITVLALIMLTFLSLGKGARMLLSALLPISLAVLVVANFFLSWLIVAIFSIVFVVYAIIFNREGASLKNKVASRFSFAPICVLVISLLFVIAGDSLSRVVTNVTGLSYVEVRPSWQSTVDIIGSTWAETPFLGSGPDRFVNGWLMHKPDGINSSIFWNTDFQFGVGLIPSFAVTTGILGILAWLLFFLVFLWEGGRVFFASSPSFSHSHVFMFSSFALALYLWIMTIFYTPGIFITALAFLMTGIFVASLRQGGLTKDFIFSYVADPRVGFVAVLASIFLLIGTVAGGYGIVKRSLSVAYYNSGLFVSNVLGDIERARDKITKSINLYRGDAPLRALSQLEVARLNVLVNRQDISPEALRAQFQEILGFAVEAARGAVEIDETNYANWLALGRVYLAVVPLNIAGAYENARASFEAAQARNPKSPLLFLELARLEALHKDAAQAREFALQALGLKNNYTDAIFLLAQLDISEGKVRDAIASLETATFLEPNNVGLFFQLGLLKYDQKDYASAASALERTISLSPDYSNAKYFLGISYYHLKKNALAIAQFEDIKKLNAGNEQVEIILQNLKNGRDPFAPPAKKADLKDAPIEE